jgi:hypothetical protein
MSGHGYVFKGLVESDDTLDLSRCRYALAVTLARE